MNKEKYEPTEGERIINAVCRASAIQDVLPHEDGGHIFVWAANAAEQIEAALAEQGYKLEKI